MKLNDKIVSVLEKRGFSVGKIKKQGNDYYVEINQHTPIGEDWWETILFDGTDEGFIRAVRERYDDFDVDEEARILIEEGGKNGVPRSVRALLEDAERKEKTLEELADELEDI